VTLSWITAGFVAFIACLFIITLILIMRYYMRRVKGDKPIELCEIFEGSVELSVYAYDPDVSGLDDITARHIGIYRDTGVITGIENDCRVYQDSYLPTKDNDCELSLIVRSALEVKRVTDTTVLYFFTRIKPLNIRSGNIRALYDCISRELHDKKPVVLRMTRFTMGDNKS